MRRWLEKVRRQKKEARLDLIPEGLTDDRRIELQNVLVNIRERFSVSFYFRNHFISRFLCDLKNNLYLIRHQRADITIEKPPINAGRLFKYFIYFVRLMLYIT